MIGEDIGVSCTLMPRRYAPPEVPSKEEVLGTVVWWCELDVEYVAGLDELW